MTKYFVAVAIGVLAVSTAAFAHVSVKPGEVGIGAYQTFSVSVPVERELPTTAVRLVVPAGLEHVTPTVKPGWTIRTVAEGEGHDAKVQEIVWTGGRIPMGQRDDFTFSAKVPAEPTTLVWKAYQTYADGSIVAWDQDPTLVADDDEEEIESVEGEEASHEEEEEESTGPYSTTNVVDDLAGGTAGEGLGGIDWTWQWNLQTIVAAVALVLSLLALSRSRRV